MSIKIKYRSIVLPLFILLQVIFFSSINPFSAEAFILFMGIFLIICDLYLLINQTLIFLSKEFMFIKLRRKKLTIVVTSIGALLVMLESLGQLTFKDIIVIIMLALIVYWYTWYIMDSSNSSR